LKFTKNIILSKFQVRPKIFYTTQL